MAEHEIDYECLVQEALRSVVRKVLTQIESEGLPGEHHFYIAFDTRAEGVSISKRLKEQYPDEMTIVLQHRFWDLQVDDDRFEVKLTFGNIPERLSVPYSAIKVFFDPSVPYGLQFEPSQMMSDTSKPPAQIASSVEQMDETGRPGTLTALPTQATSTDDVIENTANAEAEAQGDDEAKSREKANVVELDAFRKK